MDSAVGTTEYLQPNYANVQQKDENDHRKKYEPSGLVMLLIALAVIFLIIVILLAFAFHRYWRRRTDQKIRSVTAQSHQMLNNGTVATETQTYSPVKTPPQKPARSSLKTDQHRISYENVLLDVSQGRFIFQNDQFTPGTRDDVSWNLPFIDASRDCLDKIDQTEPVTENLGESKASYNIENIESQSQTDLKNNSPEREPMLDNNDNIDDEDDVFDDNTKCRLPRSPSEQIDLLFRISLSGENDA